MEVTTTSGQTRPKKRSARHLTTVYALSQDILCTVFSLLDLLDLGRCSGVCKSWRTIIYRSKLLQTLYSKLQQNCPIISDMPVCSEKILKIHLQRLAMDRHKSSLQEGTTDVFQWKGHSVGVDQCRMKMGLILTGVGDKVMRLWSVENYKCLDEFSLPDRAPLVDFDFDESKVVGLVGTRICIWKRNGKRSIFSSRESLFTKGLCMRYVDPEAVVGCEDGTARLFDMYSRKCSRIIKMHAGPVTCLALSDDQLILSGSSLGSVTISDLSSDQRVAALRTTDCGGIRTLCFNPCSHLVFSGSTSGYASCWDLRTMRTLWNIRVSPNVIYSMHHLRGDKSTLVVGGIDGVLRFLNQDTGVVFSRCIMDENSVSNSSRDSYGVVQIRKARRLSEDTRIDLIPKSSRPSIRCLGVGMQKVVTTHNEKYIKIWKFNR
ncbi:F-box/WD-40 repeat-containing protein At3g52030 [Actinidia eriantha]|uniref:F-box/WD-40 repeat-containing protein At3g52030 n=1 Tax=Actinidia eriantha TaxID=165200 RepID=UPI00258AF50D|nr:F-box/WD-40 repeat-containing protein At3g52030 [Actinidia eriantha]